MKFRLNIPIKFKKFKHIQKNEKRVLLSPEYHKLSDEKKDALSKWKVIDIKVKIGYENYHLYEIMDLILPVGTPRVTGFNTIGHIIQLNLKESHQSYKELIGTILLDHVPQVIYFSDNLFYQKLRPKRS